MIHYLGPTVGKIPLSTWEELVSAAEGGLLEETQWVELKKQLRPSGREGNLELAKDLASLSYEGGVLVLGVEDKTYEVVGCEVTGYDDRIAQVAAMTVHPPLSPVIYPAIESPDDPSNSVLVVEVPPSQHAPHMADGSYWGRSSNGKRKLGDAEVRSRMEAHANNATTFKQRLLALVDNDPLASMVVGHPTGNGHIYLLAEPCTVVTGRDDELHLQSLVVQLFDDHQNHLGTLASLRYTFRDPQGLAVGSHAAEEPVERKWEDDACHLLCRDEDSSLEYVSGGGTVFRPARNPGSLEEVLGSRTTLTSTRQFLALIRELSLKHWGYTGQWRVGIHVTNLAGKAISFNEQWRGGPQTFSGPEFTNQFVTTPASWTQGVDPVAQKLLSGYLRAIGQAGVPLDDLKLY